MASLIHIAEVAALLLVAYAIGWGIGFAARLIFTRRPAEAPAIPAERLAAAKGEAVDPNALVKAPVVVAVNTAPPAGAAPVGSATAAYPASVTVEPLPQGEPEAAKSGLESLASLSLTSPLPAPSAVLPTAPLARPAAESTVVTAPDSARTDDTVSAPEPVPVTEAPPAAPIAQSETLPIDVEPLVPAQVLSEPVAVGAAAPAAEPTPPAIPPMPASRPGVAWTGEIKGHSAAPHVPAAPVVPSRDAVVEPAPSKPAPDNAETRPDAISAAPASFANLMSETPESGLLSAVTAAMEELMPMAGMSVGRSEDAQPTEITEDEPSTPLVTELPPAAEPTTASEAPPMSEPSFVEAAAVAEPQPAPIAEPPRPTAPPKVDEDAAMRAIEGGWSRRATRALPGTPELIDVSAAVAAAQTAVQQVLAKTGLDADDTAARASAAFGKPVGLPRPRGGTKDNLKEIAGLGPLDESALNNLGIYHFEQVAGWDQKEVLWMENHVLARGRIGRENWQEQARELASGRPAPKTARV